MAESALPRQAAGDCQLPFAVQFKGSALARRILALAGWSMYFEGFPAKQGVVAVYPHTSNWDFVVMILVKWGAGVPLRFWGKDKLFRLPLFGRWLRWVGGVPVDRSSARGVVGQAVDILVDAKANDRFFWLGLAPEGTRKPSAGWRSGFYQTAFQADVPLCVIGLDYGRHEVAVLDFIRLTGDESHDMARIASLLEGVRGRVPANAAPIRLLDNRPPPASGQTDTIAR